MAGSWPATPPGTRPAATKEGHYKEFGAQIAPFVALVRVMQLNNTAPSN